MPELTDELIAECTPGSQRCLPLPDDVESARATCTPEGPVSHRLDRGQQRAR